MPTIQFYKVIQALPTERKPNSVYLVRSGAGVDLRFTDSTGSADFGLNTPKLYDSTGFLSNAPKIWVGVVSATNGFWTVDFSSAGFTLPPLVTATAEAATGNAAGNANFACVENAATTLTTAKGRAMNATSVGLLVGMANTNATCKVNIIAIGI